MPQRTASSSEAPAAAATIARFSRQRRVWSPMSPSTSAPVPGIDRRLAREEDQPAGLDGVGVGAGRGRAADRGDGFAMMGHGDTNQGARPTGERRKPQTDMNRLASETSPYLLQHADNPVDWYPWGDEALARAREEGKPILVSIGYAACHWCHVMERESFEDPQIAALMNERFVCIKVDREERPDVDAIYMDAVQALTGRGGWPLNAFLTPEGAPFYAGTYFPPEPRHGHAVVAAGRRRRRRGVARAARRDRRHRAAAPPAPGAAPRSLDAGDGRARPGARSTRRSPRCARGYDWEHGGFQTGAPKFPPASAIEFLLAPRRARDGAAHAARDGRRRHVRPDRRRLRPLLRRRALGRSPTSRRCSTTTRCSRAPTCTAARCRASRCSQRVCTETLDWALRDLRQEEGGFASSLDADSEGEEGRFYVWTPDEMRAVAGDAGRSRDFGLDGPPNFEGSGRRCGPAATRRARGDQGALREARERRVWPGLDDKRLTAWNALMISALADAGGALERPDYVEAAVACAEFVLRDLRDAEGRLLRTYNRGRAQLGAYLEDHAFLLEALLTLYGATFDPRWFAAARELAETILARFADTEHGGFFATADDHEALVARRKELEDTPIPSGASSARATACCGWPRSPASTATRRPRRACCGSCTASPRSTRAPSAHVLQALDFHLAAGEGGRDRRPGRRAARARRPRCVPPARGAGGRPGRTACRCSRAAIPSTAAPRPTSASASPACARSPHRTSWPHLL